ncbi:MAG: alpha/beta hydrolase [Acidobacteria bacterium]|nr:MAG: alpha/beta hydrolase [Acidobacteriota bacterium]
MRDSYFASAVKRGLPILLPHAWGSLVLIALLLGVCARESAAQTPQKQTFTYKQVGNLSIQADVHRLPDGQVKPVIFWIHGGALIFGDRERINAEQVRRYLEAGYILVSIDHRLAPETKLPAILEDVQDAYRWVREKGPALFQADPDRIAVMGKSAGGYVTLTAGYRFTPRPDALVSFYGYGDVVGAWSSRPDPFYSKQPRVEKEKAYSLLGTAPISQATYENRWPYYLYCRQNGLWPLEVVGLDPDKEPGAFRPYCPLQNVSEDYPPTLLLHGDKDTDVPFEQSVLMDQALERKGVPHQLIRIAGGGHNFDANMKDPRTIWALEQVLSFLKERLR